MGYIAPIHHEQYTQYANRIILRKYNYTELKPVERSFMHSKAYTPFDSSLSNKKQNPKINNDEAKLITELTGKGRYINELI